MVIISNRAPSVDGASDSGGLVVALKDALSKRGGLWIGSAPAASEDPSQSIIMHERSDFDIGLFELEPQLQRDFYLGYSNSVLWPAFHGRLDLIDVQPDYIRAYREVSKRVARMVAKVIGDDDVIWIHDYQLIPLAHELKKAGLTNRIGFFLHIPLPDLQTFRAIPEWKDIAGWLASYDVIGFQAKRDVAHLIDIFRHTLNGELRFNGNMSIDGKEISLGCFPISIDVQGFAAMAAETSRKVEPPALPRLIGVDRLDYSKGLPQRLAGYEHFLESNPGYHCKVSLLQIAPPSRDDVEAYKEIRAELEAITGRINGRFGTVDWVPLHYIHRSLPRNELAALYRYSRLALVTPLFDGMNLVAKEYVAAQDSADPGVLLLSQFAGAAEEMKEALIINPHDPQGLAKAIRRGLEMPLEERRERHEALYKRLADNDVSKWSETFIKQLELPVSTPAPEAMPINLDRRARPLMQPQHR
nr:trehalose-6-phosphate synthase [Pseudohoeflea sp. DP4N28-3]